MTPGCPLANVVLRRQGENGSSRPLLLKDVADVVIDHQPMMGDGIINDKIGLLLIVEKFPWGNTLQVTKGDVEKALDALRPGLPDLEIDHEIFRPATFIEMSIENLGMALVIASVLVVLVLFVFLYEWRVALISCTAIPLSLMAGALVLYFRETTINTMVPGGLRDRPRRRRRRRHRRRGEHRAAPARASQGAGGSVGLWARIVLEASFEVRNAIIFATLIEVMVLVPVFFMEGLSGAFFQPLALSYALAIGASIVVALTVTPALSFMLLGNAPLEKRESPSSGAAPRLRQACSPESRTRSPAYARSASSQWRASVVPQLGRSSCLQLQGAGLPDALAHQAGHLLARDEPHHHPGQQGAAGRSPGVRNFGAHIGQALIMDEVVGMYFGENWISVDPSVDYDETVRTIQTTVDGYPGLFRDLLTYLKERIREVLTGTSDAIVVRIFGRDLHTLHAQGVASSGMSPGEDRRA